MQFDFKSYAFNHSSITLIIRKKVIVISKTQT